MLNPKWPSRYKYIGIDVASENTRNEILNHKVVAQKIAMCFQHTTESERNEVSKTARYWYEERYSDEGMKRYILDFVHGF
jgi:hypothetical protein